MRKDGVLLRLVKTMDLVNKQDGSLSGKRLELASVVHDAAEVGYTGRHGTGGREVGPRGVGNDLGERGLPGTRRSPKNEGRESIVFDGAAQYAAGADDSLLTDKFVKGAGAHAGSQRRPHSLPILCCVGGR